MYEFKSNKISVKGLCICVVIACFVSLLLGLLVRPLVCHAQEIYSYNATNTDANELVMVATSTDVDTSGYLTNDTMSQTDILLSIRNILVCIWGSLVIAWAYSRMKTIIFRLAGKRGDNK